MLNNYGAHVIDLALYLCQSKARKVTCLLRSVATLGDADDVVKAVIETESGVILDIDVNMAFAQKPYALHVVGPHGSATLDYADRTWRVRFSDPGALSERTTQDGLIAEGRQYVIEDTIPWQEADFPLSEYDEVDFYKNCHAYFAGDKDPFVPSQKHGKSCVSWMPLGEMTRLERTPLTALAIPRRFGRLWICGNDRTFEQLSIHEGAERRLPREVGG